MNTLIEIVSSAPTWMFIGILCGKASNSDAEGWAYVLLYVLLTIGGDLFKAAVQ